MSVSLLTATNFPQCITSQSIRFILITSDDLNNSNFVINQYIQALSKGSTSPSIQLNESSSLSKSSQNRIFGVFLNQTYACYSFVQMKCGNNLKNLKEHDLFRCLDLISDLEQFQIESNQSGDRVFEFDFIKFKTTLIGQVEDFFGLQTSNSSTDSRVLIIDDITSFLSLNVNLGELVNFLNLLRHLASFHSITLIIQTYVDNTRLDQLVKLDTYLHNIADLVLTCSKLDTGYSNKVDGNLEIRNYIANTEQNYLFKSTERNTKLHALGTI